ncbi:MAG: hypothetical protein IJP95_00605 [Bacteroidales bacterium]|nr:hypothetical protein [Bacteroidales bacterium]
MTKKEHRAAVIADSIAHQKHVAATAKAEMDAAQQQANDYGPNKDRYDSFRTKIMRSRDMFAKQYSNAMESIVHLQELVDSEPKGVVDYGSIVVTDRQRIFVSVGMGKFVSGNETYFGISANVPVFQVMKGKKKGESFVFNGVKQTIVDVF